MIAKQYIPVLQKALPAESLAIGVLSLLYLVGIIGIITSIHPDFILLTPVNLLLSFTIMIAFHPNKDRSIYYYLLSAYLVGFSAELYGVQTGILFGEYTYGRVLVEKFGILPGSSGLTGHSSPTPLAWQSIN